MKLVDILARELKVWPFSGSRLLGQASNGSLHAIPFLGGHTESRLTISEDYEISEVSREQWQASVDALKDAAWNGDGTPPRGTKCEARPWKENDAPWVEVEFIASWLAPNGITYSWVHTGYGWKEPQMMRFRPIRTAGQIAETERLAGIAEIQKIVEDGFASGSSSSASLWDAGYRKVKP